MDRSRFIESGRRPLGGPAPLIAVGLPTVLVVLYSLAVLWFVATTGDTGIRCVFGPRVRELASKNWSSTPQDIAPEMCGASEPGEWAGEAPRAGKDGDLLTMIGGVPIEGYNDVIRAARHVRNRLGEYVEVRWNGAEGQRYGHVLVAKPPLSSYLWSVLWFIQEMIMCAIGARVLWHRPRDDSARVFFAVCVVTVVAYIGGYHWSQIATEPWLIFPFAAVVLFVPVVSLHFYLIFPRPLPIYQNHHQSLLFTLYGVPAFTAVTLWLSMGVSRWSEDERLVELAMRVIRTASLGYIVLALLMFALCLICLWYSYQKAWVSSERDQVRWLLIASILSIPPLGWLVWDACIDPARLGMSSRSAWPMSVVSLLYTLAYAFSITRYKLMQAEVLLNRSVMYLMMSMAAGLLYSGGLVVGALLIGERLLGNQASLGTVVACVTAIVLLISSGAAKNRFQSAIDRSFYREKYKFDQAMKKMSLAVDSLVDRQLLGQRLLEAACEVLHSEWGTLYLLDSERADFQLAAYRGPQPDELALTTDNPLLRRLSAVRAPIKVPHAMALVSASDQATDAMIKLGGEVATPLEARDELAGVLLLGPKRSGLAYEQEELAFLGALGSVATLALRSAGTQQTLERLNRELREKVEKIAEQQRRIIFLQQELSTTQRLPARHVNSDSAAGNLPAVPDSENPTLIPTDSLGLFHQTGVQDRGAFATIKGSGSAVCEVIQMARKVAASPAAVLIRGESGTGKELLAEAIHKTSPRSNRPFVKVHCAALSQSLLESELFGHVKGAFTDARSDRIGRFQQADGGTVFLDEIGDINLEVQTKLLRVLQEMSFERVGSSQTIQVDVRVIAATHQNLESLMKTGRFREDLYYRLNVITLRTPALRERAEDLFELSLHFLMNYARELGKDVSSIDEEAVEALLRYEWPGNIRELQNAMERAVVLCEGTTIQLDDLPNEIRSSPERKGRGNRQNSDTGSGRASSNTTRARGKMAGLAVLNPPKLLQRTTSESSVTVPSDPLDRELLAYERQRLLDALAETSGNKSEAARLLGMPRSTFFSRLRKHGLA